MENEKLDKTVEKDENKSKIITKYTFFAKKINRDYIIRSDELVKLDILIT